MDIQIITNQRVFKWEGVKEVFFYTKEHKIHVVLKDGVKFILPELNVNGVKYISVEEEPKIE